jgi:hypothetical protein
VVLLIVASLTGIFFGLYYKFFILVPFTLAAAIASSVVALWVGHSVWTGLLEIVVPAVGLQGGYMIGLTSRDLLGHAFRTNNVQSKRI